MIGSLLLCVAAVLSAAQPADGATSCRVENVTRDASGGTLARMVKRARDGDVLRARGRCSGAPVVIATDITILGGPDRATVSGDGRHPVFVVRSGATVTLRRLVIERGNSDLGGGIDNRGTLLLTGSIVRDNRGWYGAGIFNRRRLTVIDSVIRDNKARWEGVAGVAENGPATRTTLRRTFVVRNVADDEGSGGVGVSGRMTIIDSVVRANRGFIGGGVIVESEAFLRLVDSEVTANQAAHAAGIVNYGRAVATGSTVSKNTAAGTAGGIANLATFELRDSSVRDNASGTEGGGILNLGDLVLSMGSSVTANAAGTEGGGIWNDDGDGATVTLDASSSVTGNIPADCVGTPAC